SPGSANIKIEGKSVIIKHPRDAIKEGMFLIPGDREKEGLFLPHTVFFNLVYPQFPWPEKEFFLPWKELEAEADRIIDMITLVPPDKNMIVSNLSGGNQQKVVIGKWLAMSPRILLLNDPTKGVDVETRMHFYKIVRGLAQNGTSVLFYSTDTDELVANCDRVLVMFEGRITEEIRGEELGKERLLEASLRGGGGAEN
ncbi:MAG TPA: ATP-binding cassette domain-containing protein, partial [Candidatus Atribacteria bacterium]|nr:ATP-binding cassette domain-containing protein [Candidatus Atribacteria bacterium]